MLKIDRFTAEYRVPASQPDASGWKHDLDGLVRGDLVQALRRRLQRNVAFSDESIWLIRSLRTEVEIPSNLSRERIVESWADAIAREFEQALAEPELPAHVLHFAGEAELIARYVFELANGSAHGKWYFRRFEGLAALMPSAAIRTALTSDPLLGMAAAARLTARDWLSVEAALTEGDAARILAAWRVVERDPSPPERIWRLWQEGRFAAPSEMQLARVSLRLTAAALRENPTAPCGSTAAAITRLVHLMRHMSATPGTRLIEWLIAADVPRLYKVLGADHAEALQPLMGAAVPLLEEIAKSAPGNSQARGMTRFGGLFLLLPLMEEMPFAEIAEVLGSPDVCLLRFLTAMKCFGSNRAIEFLNDPIVQSVLGFPEPISIADAGKYLRRIARHTGRAEEFLNDRLRREQLVSGTTLTIGVPGRRIHAVADSARGIWVRLGRRQGGAEAPLPSDPHIELQLRRLGLAAAELDHLDFPSSFHASDRCNLFLSRVANVLLRNFAWRLPGFSSSSIPYLVSNCLDMPAHVERDESGFHVSLARPPLHVILSIAGMMQREFTPSWLENCIVSLSAEAQ